MLLFIFSIAMALAQTSLEKDLLQLNERISTIDNFLPSYRNVKNKANDLSEQLKVYNHPNLIQTEKKQLQQMHEEVVKIDRALADPESKLFTMQVKKEFKAIEEKVSERNKYLQTLEIVKKMEREAAHNINGLSKRYVKYISLLKEGNDTQADVLFRLLPQSEKDKAKQYQEARTYSIQQAGVQDYLEKSIKEEIKKIESKLTYPEKYIQEAITFNASLDHFNVGFHKIKQDMQLVQFDFEIKEAWQVGVFSCNAKNPRAFYTLNNYPGLILLKNDEGTSIIKIDEANPKSFEIVYKCQKTGMFGLCTDNTAKEYCKIDSDCNYHLNSMEQAFNRQAQFETHQKDYTKSYLDSTLDNFLQNFYTAYKENDHYLSKERFQVVYQQILSEQNKIIAKTPEEYARKYKVINEKYEKQMLADLTKIKNYDSKSEKARISQTMMKYFFLTLQGHTDTLMNNDNLQKFSFNRCQKANTPDQFCQSYASWQKAVQKFDDLTPINNLVMNECPRVVFRKDQKTEKYSPHTCGPEYSVPPLDFSPFNSEVQTIIKNIK
jgi:hypothetical protein